MNKQNENIIYKFLRDLLEVLEDIFLLVIVRPGFWLHDLFSKKKSKEKPSGVNFLEEQEKIIAKLKKEK